MFRQDGTYLSLTGQKPHKIHHDYRSDLFTLPYSYNMFRVIDDDTVIMLGSTWCNFYVKGTPQPVIQIGFSKSDKASNESRFPNCKLPEPLELWRSGGGNLNLNDNDPIFTLQVLPDSFSEELTNTSNIGLYDYLGITNPSNPIETARQIALLPKEKLLALRYGPESFSEWNLVNYADDWQPDWLESEDPSWGRVGGLGSRMVNDYHDLYSQNGETRLIYGILRSSTCPYVFVPCNKDPDNPDYIYAINHFKQEWHVQSSFCLIL